MKDEDVIRLKGQHLGQSVPTKQLINICRDFFEDRLSAVSFVEAFDQAFHENEEALPEPEYSVFDEIAVLNDLFEPNNSIRSEDENLLDEATLKVGVAKRIHQLIA